MGWITVMGVCFSIGCDCLHVFAGKTCSFYQFLGI